MLWLMAGLCFAAPEMIPDEPVDLLGRTAPDFEGELNDETFKLSETRGKVVVLSFWASWCGPCRKELPALSELQKQRPDLAIYAVNVDRDRRQPAKFLREVSFDLPIVWDNQAIALGGYNVTSMPTMFLLDKQGTIKFRKTGFSTANGLKELEAAIGSL